MTWWHVSQCSDHKQVCCHQLEQEEGLLPPLCLLRPSEQERLDGWTLWQLSISISFTVTISFSITVSIRNLPSQNKQEQVLQISTVCSHRRQGFQLQERQRLFEDLLSGIDSLLVEALSDVPLLKNQDCVGVNWRKKKCYLLSEVKGLQKKRGWTAAQCAWVTDRIHQTSSMFPHLINSENQYINAINIFSLMFLNRDIDHPRHELGWLADECRDRPWYTSSRVSNSFTISIQLNLLRKK